MMQKRIFMWTTQPFLEDQDLETKLFPLSEHINDDYYGHGSLSNFFPLPNVYFIS
jgi:hypothetical protein